MYPHTHTNAHKLTHTDMHNEDKNHEVCHINLEKINVPVIEQESRTIPS